MIRTHQLQKVYRANQVETVALDGVDLAIDDGEFVSIMGPSGCGKSTLLSLLGLLDTPSDGHVYLHDRDVSQLPERARTRLRKGNIGFVFQSFNLIDEQTVGENVALPLLYLRVPARERAQRVQDALQRARIDHRRDHYPHQLSGGQQQRVAIARAIVSDPMLILADEPTGNLDSANGEEILELLADLHREATTIVMVTHSLRDAEFSGRIVHLYDGRVVDQPSPSTLAHAS